MERVKLIWDFRGPNAGPIASHHAKHLSEFIEIEGLEGSFAADESLSEMHSIAFLVVEKERMQELRERLKPNRGQLFTE
jgi:hypothetical protein